MSTKIFCAGRINRSRFRETFLLVFVSRPCADPPGPTGTGGFIPAPFSNPPAPSGSDAPLYAVMIRDIGVYGIGRTRELAIEAAKRFLRDVEDKLDAILGEEYDPEAVRDLYIARVTPRYALEIEKRGGCGWVRSVVTDDGIYDLAEGVE